MEKRNTYVRMLFNDYSSAFNTIVPSKLITKLKTQGLNISLCNWIRDFLMGPPLGWEGRQQHPPQWCVLSPLLYSLFTHDCVAAHDSNTIIKVADDMTVVGLISNDNETIYREEVRDLAMW
jgi:gmma-aminobutyric acid receptor subunit gamma/cGMP-dependent protein kinase 2